MLKSVFSFIWSAILSYGKRGDWGGSPQTFTHLPVMATVLTCLFPNIALSTVCGKHTKAFSYFTTLTLTLRLCKVSYYFCRFILLVSSCTQIFSVCCFTNKQECWRIPLNFQSSGNSHKPRCKTEHREEQTNQREKCERTEKREKSSVREKYKPPLTCLCISMFNPYDIS